MVNLVEYLFMSYSNDLRERAVDHYLHINRNYKEVASLYKIGIATLYNWVKRFLLSGSVDRKKSTGRPRLISSEESSSLRQMVLDNADSSLATLAQKWQELSGKQVSAFTISRNIRRIGLSYKKNFQSQRAR